MTGKGEHCCHCGKSFTTAVALKQHKADKHREGRAAVKGGKKKKAAAGGAAVSTGVSYRNSAAQSAAREAGRDRFMHVDDISKIDAGHSVVTLVFSPHLLPRLARLASAYQRYVVHKLVFHIVPMVSTATSGGYVAAFVRDPDDQINGKNAANILTATAGSITTKWWQDSSVACPQVADRFYTATTPGQERFSSPGALCIAVDGKATQSGSLTIYCEYDVSFYAAGLESQPDNGNVVVVTDLRMAAGNDYIETGTGKKSAADMFIPTPVVGTVLVLPHPIYYLVNDSGSVTSLACYKYIHVVAANSVRPCSKTGTDYGQKTYNNATVLFEGEELTISKVPSENLQKGSEFLCYQRSTEPSRDSGVTLERSSSPTRMIPGTSGDCSTLSPEVLAKAVSYIQEILSASTDLPKESSQDS